MVFQVQRGVQVMKIYQKQVTQPNTEKQAAAKSHWTQVTKYWKTLSGAKKALWAAYAKAGPIGIVSEMRIGTKPLWRRVRGPLEGHSVFFRVNFLRRLCGLSFQDEPPVDRSVPQVSIAGVEWDGTQVKVTIGYRGFAFHDGVGGYIMVWYRPPDPYYAAIQAIVEITDDAGTVAVYTDKISAWGDMIEVADIPGRWRVQCRAIRQDGQLSAPSNLVWFVVEEVIPPAEIVAAEEAGVVEGTERVEYTVVGADRIFMLRHGEVIEGTESVQLEVVAPPPAEIVAAETGVVIEGDESVELEVT